MKHELITRLFNSFDSLLSKPGDSFSAKVTKSGRQVIKIVSGGKKASATRYPSTGTIVQTLVKKNK